MPVEETAYLDPIQAFAPWAGQPWSILLDSARLDGAGGRYSYICVNPFQTLMVRDGHPFVDGGVTNRDPFDLLDEILARMKLPQLSGLPPFQGGAAGYIGYEMGRFLEQVNIPNTDDMRLPDMALGFYDQIIAFDGVERRAWIIARDIGGAEPAARLSRLRAGVTAARAAPLPPVADRFDIGAWNANFTRTDYEAAVTRVIEYILEGDIFQANIAQRFSVALGPQFDRFGFYRRLRAVNAAPHAAFLEMGEFAIASSSPERFLKLADTMVEARPIKGTRPRGATPEQDDALARELTASEKDRAENIMIVDLLRNDLSRVCEDGSVDVPSLCALESFASVHHLVSTVTGVVRRELGPVDVLRAAFPGGSITGAPKIRAMQVIAEIEPHIRGPYCGGLGYIGFDGSMDMNIAIRTIAMNARQAVFHAGGGIVVDSVPSAEYAESLDKARALFTAFGLAPPESGAP
ncbi:MAG: aminodeoxychorismate synthase component I [Alphaproteobacteria bacterium]|nr:aminodeoxychorismate synthase component I [Alphaproteobacteria bacterium]